MTSVGFNPVYNEWSSACIDGHIRTFRYPAFKSKVAPKGKPGGGLKIQGQSIKVQLPENEIEEKPELEMY